MSFLFVADDATVWSPSLRVGQVFVGCAQALSEAVEVEPGFVFNSSDMIWLHIEQHTAFVDALTKIATGHHPVFANLARPVWAPCVVMLRRAGATIDVADSDILKLIETYAASMPQ